MTPGSTAAVPLVDGIFTIGTDRRPALLASRCTSCGVRFFPPRERCSACSHAGMEVAEAAREGELYTWTVVRELGGQREGFVPYVVGQIDLADGLRVTGIVQCEPDDLRIGMPMRLCLIEHGDDAAGNQLVAYGFEPAR